VVVFRSIVIAAFVLCAGAPAFAQATLDVKDPSISKKPTLDVESATAFDYPPHFLRNRVQGEVGFKLCLDQYGKITATELVRSSGNADLDRHTASALAKARFHPAEAGVQKVAVCGYSFSYVWKVDVPPVDPTVGYENAFFMSAANKPVLVSRPEVPAYPPAALQKRKSGKVRLSMCIGADGDVDRITILSMRADHDLIIATFEWMQQSKYQPGTKNGKPVGVCGIDVEHEWKLPS
jgi:TonB family protein